MPTVQTPTRPWLAALLLAGLVFIAYIPVWHAGFIWDDDSHLTANPCIIGPLGFKEIWTSARAVYYPLVLTTFWAAHRVWGLAPLPYHLLNIAAQAGCAILLWRVLLRLRVQGAWLGAAIWALHPVQVESAAWITELKNTQSGIYYLLAILFFLRWRHAPWLGRGWYLLALLCFALAILSKSSTVMLPVVLALCWWWLDGGHRGWWRWKNALWLAPFFAISAGASVWTVWEQKYSWGAIGPAWAQTRPERLVIAGKDLWFYLGKLLWPHPLTFIYPRWQVGATHLPDWLPLLAAAAWLAVLWHYRKGGLRPVFFAAAYYVVSLFPVLDFFNVYFFRYSFVGDHFQFLASMGPLALAGSAITCACRAGRNLYPAVSAAVLALLGAITWMQCGVYQSLETLWRATLANNPDCWMAHYNLGDVLIHQGKLDEAAAEYREDVRLNPGSVEAHGNLANTLFLQGKTDAAIAEYHEMLRLQPDLALAHENLSAALLKEGDIRDAIAHAGRAIEIDPHDVNAMARLAWMLATGEPESLRDGPRAVDLALRVRAEGTASDPLILRTLAAAYAQAGRFGDAIHTAGEAIEAAAANPPLVEELRWELGLYESNSPYRRGP